MAVHTYSFTVTVTIIGVYRSVPDDTDKNVFRPDYMLFSWYYDDRLFRQDNGPYHRKMAYDVRTMSVINILYLLSKTFNVI